MKQSKWNMRKSSVIKSCAALVLLALGSLGMPNHAQAANGQCTWEGGPGASGGFAYCLAEDCMGNGGLARCTKAVGAYSGSLEPILGPDKWAYGMCDHFNPHMANIAQWCYAAGGDWEGSQEGCVNLPPGIFTGGAGTNSEGSAMSIAQKWADGKFGSSCGATVISDTGWHATLSSQLCWSGSDSTSMGILTKSLRKKTYQSTGPGCSGTLSISFLMDRQAKCPAGYKTRSSAPIGQQCYIAQCCNAKSEMLGNPTSPISGSKIQEEVDYLGPGSIDIQFVRTYNSGGFYRPSNVTTNYFASDDMQNADYWIHTYDRRLYLVTGSTEIIALNRRQNGNVTSFDSQGHEVGQPSGAGGSLVEIPGFGWDLTLTDRTTERYDYSGRLLTITTRTNRVTTLSYTNGHLTTVTGPFGHALQLAYDPNGRLETLTLPGGEIIGYEHDEWGRLVSVNYPARATRTYSYDSARHGWLLTAIADDGVNYATYSYDTSGRVVDSQHAGGADRFQFSYPSSASTQVTDPSGSVFNVGIQSAGGFMRRNSVSTPCKSCGSVASSSYDANGNPSATVGFDGTQTLFLYDPSRNLQTWRTEGAGSPLARVVTTSWHPTFNLPIEIQEPGRSTTYTYDSEGNRLTRSVTDTGTNRSQIWTRTYNSYGQLLSEDGPRTDIADVSSYTYYSCTTGFQCGQLATVTNAAGHVTTYLTYDAHGNPLTISDPNGNVTALTYDANQRMVSRTTGTETATSEYWPNGLLKKSTEPNGQTDLYTYDDAQRLIGVTDQDGNRMQFTLDAAGNRIREDVFDLFNTLIRTKSATFDALGRRISDVGANMQTTTYEYDEAGRLATETDPMNRVSAYVYDELGRTKELIDSTGNSVQYGFDSLGQVSSVSDTRGIITSYDTDAFGNIVSQDSQDTGVTTKEYNNAGNLEESVDARGRLAQFAYDALGRVTSIEYADQDISYTYDSGINGIGRLAQISNSASSLSWTYDSHGRTISRTQSIGALARTFTYGYGASGELESSTTPSGQLIQYHYSNGKLSGIDVNGTQLITQIVYAPFGPTRGWQWGNGTLAVREYDADGRLATLDSAGMASYLYYPDGSIKSISDDSLAPSSASMPSVSIEISSTSNRIVSISDGLLRSVQHDSAGNTLSDGYRTFVYNDAGRMSQSTGAGVMTTYSYNGIGQRVLKVTGNTAQYFVYDDDGHLVGVYGPGGVLVEEIVWFGDIPIASVRTTETGGIGFFYIHTDHLNSPIRLTRASDNAIMWRWDRDPYGNGAPNEDADGNSQYVFFNLRFPGQYFDGETGLSYNYFRDYDSSIGRYVESDPIGLRGGTNTYAYVGGSPVDAVDPLGLIEWKGALEINFVGLTKSVLNGGYQFGFLTLFSPCVRNQRWVVNVSEKGWGFAPGKGMSKRGSMGTTTVTLEDGYTDTIDPYVFNGTFSMLGFGVKVYSFKMDLSVGQTLGSASGWGISTDYYGAVIMTGKAKVTAAHPELCNVCTPDTPMP